MSLTPSDKEFYDYILDNWGTLRVRVRTSKNTFEEKALSNLGDKDLHNWLGRSKYRWEKYGQLPGVYEPTEKDVITKPAEDSEEERGDLTEV